ncbi:trimeric intracellular cation channel type A isoform X1 [Apteryx rowi]|uniref:trimeric intracellular cation channel type A isoform X1 n=2 Tax=Apteryx rowi TaxID=308060 RepID=UPI000E1C8CDC|nr:trimeric intracellular cation channel type A isoform X1 [Apteryx rowi]
MKSHGGPVSYDHVSFLDNIWYVFRFHRIHVCILFYDHFSLAFLLEKMQGKSLGGYWSFCVFVECVFSFGICFTGAVEMSRRSPFASWLCAMLHCFGSYILADLLLGESPLHYFSNNSSVVLATAVWYLIFFCPMDLFYKCVSFLPLKLVFVAMKEVVRVRKIVAGVHHAHHHGWFVMMATGWVKGSGVALMSNFEQLLRGVWKPETNEILHMSFPTKASLYGTLLFTLQQTRWLPISEANLIFFFTMFMIVCKVFMTATHSHASPFAPVEDFICPVFFGSVSSGHTSHHHDQHGASHDVSHPPPPPPAKSKEELNEGTRKRKAKKAE